MISFSHYIGDFLRQNHSVSLEKIGVLTLSDKPQKNEEGEILHASHFVFDKKAETSAEFIAYLVQTMNKPASIVQSDLEYFLDQSRQLMNIRTKPLIIEGFGYIYSDNSGAYVLGHLPPEGFSESEANKKQEDLFTERTTTFKRTNYAANKNRNRNIGRWVLIVILIALIAYGFYYVKSTPNFFKNVFEKDTTAQTLESPIKKDTTIIKPKIIPAKVNGFKFIIQSFDGAAKADKRVRQLKSYGNIVKMDSIAQNGQVIYRLYVTDSIATVADTARIKDSLRAYYGHPVIIE